MDRFKSSRFTGVLRGIAASVLGIGTLMTWTQNASADLLTEIQKRGYLNCGVSHGEIGFSKKNGQGQWEGIDVDICRGVAAALFGNDSKVSYIPLLAKERFDAITNREVDLVSRNTTWTLFRDGKLGIDFTNVVFYDGQGFMLRKDLDIKSTMELNGATICVEAGTTTELNLIDFFNSNGMEYKSVVIDTADEALLGYEQGRCDVYTGDRSALAAKRTTLSEPDLHVVLDEVISQEPLGPALIENESRFSDVISWTIYAMQAAEMLGVTSQNVEELRSSSFNPEIRRLLGLKGNFHKGLGTNPDWSYDIIRLVGNYEEVFERNVGQQTALGLERGLNALWTDGGIIYPMPFR